MAKMDGDKLNAMCTAINGKASEYVTSVENASTELKNVFNELWVSNASQSLATEIAECLKTLDTGIRNTFSGMNDAIKNSVQNFNAVEGESISYSGYSFAAPTIDLTLNKTLADGKVGVTPGTDLSQIKTPIDTMVGNITSALDSISTTVSTADAFDSDEQTALTNSVTQIKNTFVNGMGQIESTLATRLSSEADVRTSLDTTNISNLSVSSES